jgi:hypothetical protein
MGSVADADACYRVAAAAGRDPQPGLSLLRLVTGDVRTALKAISCASVEHTAGATRVRVLAAAVEVHLGADDVAAASAAADALWDVAATLDTPFVHLAVVAGSRDALRGREDAPDDWSCLPGQR